MRLTVYPDGPGDGLEVAKKARAMGVKSFALQQAREFGTPEGFEASRGGWDDQVCALAADIEELNFDTFVFRHNL